MMIVLFIVFEYNLKFIFPAPETEALGSKKKKKQH